MSVLDRYSMTTLTYKVGEIEIELYQTSSLDSIVEGMTEEDFGPDERFPYFLTTWDSGLELARYLIEEPQAVSLPGKKVLELGSGTGISGIFAAKLGAEVTFSDYEEESLKLCESNGRLNNIDNFHLLTADWRNFPTLDSQPDLVIGSDLLYEERQCRPLFETVASFIKEGIEFYLSDPGRDYIDKFLELCRNSNFQVDTMKEYNNRVSKVRNVKVYRIKLSC